MTSRLFSRGLVLTMLLSGATALASASPPAGLQPTPAVSASSPTAGPSQRSDSSDVDIRDIRGPIHIPDWWRLWLVGLAALVAAGAVLTGVRALRRRSQRPLLPHERALARLEEAEALASAGRPREYAEAASEAVRSYLEERFGIHATVQTTEEFFETVLRARPRPLLQGFDESIDLLRHFLGACDLAKFSRYPLPREDMAALNRLARTFVLQTWQAASSAPETPVSLSPHPATIARVP